MKFIKNATHKRKRQILGTMMFIMFMAECQTIYFFIKTSVRVDFNAGIAFLLMLGIYWYFWVPPIICIILIYLILMRVLKYQEVDN